MFPEAISGPKEDLQLISFDLDPGLIPIEWFEARFKNLECVWRDMKISSEPLFLLSIRHQATSSGQERRYNTELPPREATKSRTLSRSLRVQNPKSRTTFIFRCQKKS